jgi:hypothetical protein
MRSNHWRFGLMLAVVLPILAAGSCTGSDPIAPQTQQLTISAGMVNPDPVYDVLAFQVDRIIVMPTDPEANQSVDSAGINLLSFPIEYFSVGDNAPSQLALTNGTYEMDPIILNNILLVEQTNPTNRLVFFQQVSISAEDYGSDVFISVENGAANQFSVVVDAAALAIAYEAAASIANPNTQPDQFADALSALASQYLILE